ncbi:DUF2019 domain-containing protein [Corallococcus macrosporus]|uniref:DUF2019 domain-containing protein n=1 Tax=Corallococcus macrosporus TaxID=35 RepID=A0ABS3D4Q4_9BACT|nr:DUF2019 domain-containing protein [Corallococcus macrosporus]MBN8226050.1 DUF2019 domain-containing protein [Corallococcus macrosporus]
METKALVEQFAHHVVAQNEALFRDDPRAGNKHARKYIAAVSKLFASGDTGREALCVLLKHERMDVRVMAAAFLLRYRTEESKAVLEEAAKGTGLVPFGAQQTLRFWAEGTWSLDLG